MALQKKVWTPRTFNAADHYLYLSSLTQYDEQLYAAAQQALSYNFSEPDISGQDSIERALAFLESSAVRQENAEMTLLRSKGIEVNSITGVEDIYQYIASINETIIGIDNLRERLITEQNRRGISGEGGWSGTQALGSYIQSALNELNSGKLQSGSAAGQKLAKGENAEKENKETLSATTRKVIYNKIQKALSGQNDLTIAGLIALIQSEGADEISRTFPKTKKSQIGVKQIDEILTRASPLYAQLKKKQTSPSAMDEALDLVEKTYSRFALKKNDALKALKAGEGKNYYIRYLDESRNRIIQKAKQVPAQTDIEVVYSFSSRNVGAGGETSTAVDLMQDYIPNLLGGTGGKTDVIAFGEVIANITDKNGESYAENLSSYITQEMQSSTKKVTDGMRQQYLKIDQALTEQKNKLKDLSDTFIIESNVKDYVSTEKESSFKGFESGSWKALDFINYLSDIAPEINGIIDTDLLITMLINTHPDSVVGSANVNSLQKIFAAFATQLLFDDAELMVESTFSLQTLNVIHLFSVNRVYIPASSLMRLIAANLRAVMEDTSKRMMSSSPITITGNNTLKTQATLDELTEARIFNQDRWKEMRSRQIDNMVIKLAMLANFSSLIDSIFSKI